MGKEVITAGIIGTIAIGMLPFLFLLWDHPFVGGTPDVVTFAQHTKTTIAEATLTARAEHGYYTAIQLFPHLILENTALTLFNDLPPLLNLWILQHIATLVMTALFFLLGRLLTGSLLGGIFSALSNMVLLDIPIFIDSGLPRFLSSYFYSQLFLIAFITYLTISFSAPMRYLSRRLLLFFLATGMLFSHHHFGIVRTIVLAASLIVAWILSSRSRGTAVIITEQAIIPALETVTAAVIVWVVFNYPLIPFFIHNFVR